MNSSYIKDLVKILNAGILPTAFSNTKSPRSVIEQYEVYRTGLTVIGKDYYRQFGFVLPTAEEKNNTTSRIGILDKETGNYIAHYMRLYDITSTQEKFTRMLQQSVLEAYPTPNATYDITVVHDVIRQTGRIGSAVVDLNNLRTRDDRREVGAIRFDRLLHGIGFRNAAGGLDNYPDLRSFMDVQKFINDETVQMLLTPRAILQVVLSSYFIPNAIGETDANSRNIILLKDPSTGLYDVAVRIDAEENTEYRDQMGMRSGDRRVPKGIYGPNEAHVDFIKNIQNHASDIDWELFSALFELSENYLSKENLYNINNDYSRNKGRYNGMSYGYPAEEYLDYDAHDSFRKAATNRVARHINDVNNALGSTSSSSVKILDQLGEQSDASHLGEVIPKEFNEHGEEVSQ